MVLPDNYSRNGTPYRRTSPLLESAERTASGVGEAKVGSGWAAYYTFVLNVTATEDAAADQLNVFIQRQLPNGDWDDVVAFNDVAGDDGATVEVADVMIDSASSAISTPSDASLSAGSLKKVYVGDTIRVKWVIVDDTDPAFTFDVTMAAKA